ncbi:adenylate/guanylate cyclase domain-containing protein [Candidatus Reidiella endopervernicosa]|uniref:HAMP domain-containing protein n=1 Tax=Candidatus Reidiella endopervernicosa TaxID=2738883 RepID=A0A6N0HSD9_9GAMM|nr:adenylate/guanylate cyclase domain-containing protein [Candidatus Reidiella endopervernicosa]QKQ25160.1 HAMP domain-containing protein [Candidatus Reidiella endopervernicosa]
MQLFYLTPFSLSVLNVAIMLTLLTAYLWRIPGKLPATRQLLTFLSGVNVVFVAFFYIFSSLDLDGVRIAWWALHFVVFFILFLIQFAYHYPKLHFPKEARRVFIVSLIVSVLVYLFYLYHTTLLEPIYDPSGGLFVYLGTHEISVLVGLELLWAMSLFVRQIRALRREGEGDALQRESHIAAIRKIFLILLSPIVLVALIILAYLDLASWEIVGHLLGTGLMIFVLLFTVVYLNNALEPSSLQIKMVGLSLGAILVVLGFSSAITMNLHKESYLSLKKVEIERSGSEIVASRFEALPEEISFIAREGELIYQASGFDAELSGESGAWEGAWRFRKLEPLEPQSYFITRSLTLDGASYEVGYSYHGYRAHLHEMAEQLLYIVIGAVLFAVIAFPLFFRVSLFIPLQRLLGGVDRMEQGSLDVDLPVGVHDEIGVLTKSFNTMVGSVREGREQLRAAYDQQIDLTDAYSRFVPKEIITTLNKQSILELGLGDNIKQEMTVLFSDIRSFTTISESMSPEQIFRFINRYLEEVGPIVRKHGGYIDKYIGDAVMALFPGGPDDALATAIEMQSQVRDFNQRRAESEEGYVEVRIGVGIHTGELMLGTIGEHQRMEGTVISDAVNLASRIEGLTKAYNAPILISNATYTKLASPAQFNIRHLDRVKVKGKTEWVEIVEVLDGEEEIRRAHKLANRDEFDKAVETFQARRFKEALEQFNTLKQRDEIDVAVDVYIERCQQFIEQGIPENWDGAIQL